ncbi:hypothetical protein FE845_14385 [Marinobacter sp. 1-4A]|jgi:hypothetical protein|uniref:hypothetical protein n=1 Tax=Gammaproteobacteria TaxID=1236 RepID=UPI0019042B9D|nr:MULTISPECIES: hypothetical protein [unclassified Marinobacter]MBK1852535.1 hypothetical protein [Marinobacter sp. 1-4A]MBK1888355.1 hypothetical protein [Marinobacter sp. DY40_1A1]
MQIGSAIATSAITPTQKSGNNMPPQTTMTGNTQPNQPLARELAETFDPKNMNYNESMALASALMKAGEGDLSSAFLPPPLLKVNSDGSVIDTTGTPEADAKMNNKFNMFETLTARIDFNKSMNLPTDLLEDAYSFLEKVQVARNTPSINEYT